MMGMHLILALNSMIMPFFTRLFACSFELSPAATIDVAVLSLSVFFSSACRAFLQNNPGKVITIYNIGQLVGEAWTKLLTPENLISGFRHCGIYPLCRAKITPEKLAPSTSTKKKSQKSIDEILAPSDTSKDEISTKKKAPGL